ncbi:MAG: hypothetical protein QF411_09435, partial [Planctomycetota bacterium]|nr:hypothetical protein [Planctomycetota bacterium]
METQNADGSWGQPVLAGIIEGIWHPDALYSWQMAAVSHPAHAVSPTECARVRTNGRSRLPPSVSRSPP